MTSGLKKVKQSNLTFDENLWISTNSKCPTNYFNTTDIYYISEYDNLSKVL